MHCVTMAVSPPSGKTERVPDTIVVWARGCPSFSRGTPQHGLAVDELGQEFLGSHLLEGDTMLRLGWAQP